MVINLCHAQRVMSAEDVIRFSGGRISFFEGIYRETRPQFVSWRLFNPVTLDESRIIVKYDVDIKLDSISEQRVKDQVLTLIGPKMILSYGLWNWTTTDPKMSADICNSVLQQEGRKTLF